MSNKYFKIFSLMTIPHLCGIFFLIKATFPTLIPALSLPIPAYAIAAICFALEFIGNAVIFKKTAPYYAACNKAFKALLIYGVVSSAGLIILYIKNESRISFILGLVLIIYSFITEFTRTSAFLGLLYKYAAKASDAFFKLWQIAIYIYLLQIASYLLRLWKAISGISQVVLYLASAGVMLLFLAQYITLLIASRFTSAQES